MCTLFRTHPKRDNGTHSTAEHRLQYTQQRAESG